MLRIFENKCKQILFKVYTLELHVLDIFGYG